MVAMIGPRPIFSQDMRRDDHKSEAEVDMGTARGMLCFVGVFEIHVCPMELVRHCQTGVSFFLKVLVEGSGAVAWGVTEYRACLSAMDFHQVAPVSSIAHPRAPVLYYGCLQGFRGSAVH